MRNVLILTRLNTRTFGKYLELRQPCFQGGLRKGCLWFLWLVVVPVMIGRVGSGGPTTTLKTRLPPSSRGTMCCYLPRGYAEYESRIK